MLMHAHKQTVLVERFRDFESTGRVHISGHDRNTFVRLLRVSEDVLSLENYLKILFQKLVFLIYFLTITTARSIKPERGLRNYLVPEALLTPHRWFFVSNFHLLSDFRDFTELRIVIKFYIQYFYKKCFQFCLISQIR